MGAISFESYVLMAKFRLLSLNQAQYGFGNVHSNSLLIQSNSFQFSFNIWSVILGNAFSVCHNFIPWSCRTTGGIFLIFCVIVAAVGRLESLLYTTLTCSNSIESSIPKFWRYSICICQSTTTTTMVISNIRIISLPIFIIFWIICSCSPVIAYFT